MKKRKLFGVAVCVVAVPLLLLGLLHTPPLRRAVFQRLTAYLSRSQGMDLRAQRFDYNLLSATFIFEGVSLRNTASGTLPPFLTADRVRLRLSYGSMMRGGFKARYVDVERLRLDAVLKKDGGGNISLNSSKAPAPKPIDLPFDTLDISSLSIAFRDEQHGFSVQLTDGMAKSSVDQETGDHEILYTLQKRGAVYWQGREVPVENLTLNALFRKEKLTVRSFSAAGGGIELKSKGTLQSLDLSRIDLLAQLEVQGSGISSWLHLEQALAGRAQATIKISGSVQKLTAEGELQASGVKFGELDLNGFAAKGRFESSSGVLELKDVTAKTDLGQIQASAELLLFGKPQSKIHLAARTPDLRGIGATMGWRLPPQGEASVDITVSSPVNDWKKASFSAGLTVSPHMTARLSGRRSGDLVHVDIGSISGYGASVKGFLDVHTRDLSTAGELTGSVGSLAQLTRSLEPSFGKAADPPLPFPIDGRVEFRAALSGTLRAPRVAMDVTGIGLSTNRIKDAALHVKADYGPDRLLIQQARLDWQGHSAMASGEIGLESPSAPLHIEGNSDQIPIADILQVWVPDADVGGIANAKVSAAGARSSPTVLIQIEAHEIEAYGELLGKLEAEAEWKGQSLVLSRFRLEKPQAQGALECGSLLPASKAAASCRTPNGTLEASGLLNLHSREYQFNLEGKNLQFPKLTRFGDVPVAGILQLQASGKGDIDNPEIRAEAEWKDVRVADETIGNVRGSLLLADRQGRVLVENAVRGIEARAEFTTDGTWPFRVDITTGRFPYSFKTIAERMATITSSVVAHGEGTIRPAAIREASAVMNDLEFEVGNKKIRSEKPLEIGYASRRLRFQPATFTSEDITLKVSGDMPLNGEGDPGKITLAGEIGLNFVDSFFPAERAINVRGKAVLGAEIRGNLRSLDPTGTLTIEGGHLDSNAIPAALDDIRLTLRLIDRRFRLDGLNAKIGEGTIRASADIPAEFVAGTSAGQMSAGMPASFSVETNAVSFSLSPQVRGVFSGRFAGESSAADVKSITAQLNVDEFSLYADAFSIRQAKPAVLTVKNGQISFDQWNLAGAQGELQLSGSVGIGGKYPLDLRMSGNADANIVSLFSPSTTGRGSLRMDLRGQGTVLNPLFAGILEMNGGTIGMQKPRILAENLNLRLALDNNRLDIQTLEGLLNGGRIRGNGNAVFRKDAAPSVNIELSGQDVFLDYPRGVRSSSNLKFQVRSIGPDIVVGGEVDIREGSYVEPFDFMGMSAADLGSADSDGKEAHLLGSTVRYDIKVKTIQPFEINNNLAKLSTRVDVHLVGSPKSPGMLGTMTLDRGGKVYFGGRTYYTERGIVTFANDTRIDPVYDLLATTQVSDYQVLLRFSGTRSEIATTFTSDPPLSQNDIVALLLTGKPMSESGGTRVDPAQAEKMSVLSGVLNADLSARMRRRFGISQVMIQPSLISGESDPGARLTVGQDLSQSLRFVYSMNLVNSADQVWYTEYDFQRRFTMRAVMQDDNTYRGEFRQDIRFGGRKTGSSDVSYSSQKLRVGKIEFTGNTIFDPATLAHELKIAPGDKFNFVKSRKRIERLQSFYAKKDFLAARVHVDRQDHDPQVDLTIQIEAGPKVTLEYAGAKVPKSVNKQVRAIWQEGISDIQRSEEASQKLLEHFTKHRYPQAKVAARIDAQLPDEKHVIFELQPGVQYKTVRPEFAGAAPAHAASITIRLKSRKLFDIAGARPDSVIDEAAGYYRQKGYYLAAIGMPRFKPDEKDKVAKFIFPVKEGPQVRVRMLQFQGNKVLNADELRSDLPLKNGAVLNPEQLKKTTTAVADKYGREGYRNAKIEQRTVLNEKDGLADLIFSIQEGDKSVIRSLKIAGQERVSENYIRRQLKISEGEPQDFPETRQSIRNLYDTGGFSNVDIESVPSKSAPAGDGETKSVDVTVKVQEVAPFKFVYGVYYDSEGGPGGIIEIEKRNWLGGARVLGLRTRYDSALQEARLYFNQPLWLGHKRPTTGTIFYRREKDYYEGLAAERAGFTLQQEVALKKKLVASYGYRFEHVNSWYPDQSAPDPPRANVAPLTFSLSRSTRDDFLDPTRGSFTSVAFEFGPKALGSSYGYTRLFNQYFKYFPLGKPGFVPFQEDTSKPRLVYATGIRLGWIAGLTTDQVIPTERFYAGGGTTVRGFKQDGLGPLDAAGDPLGGNVMLVLNNELRFPMVSILDGVGFIDIGNVFPLPQDFKFSELRKTAGIGLRLRTPSLMLRFDYGFKLDRRPGESAGAFFFSIGQAF
jgi:outer membrane protein assembly complex protein YaeT